MNVEGLLKWKSQAQKLLPLWLEPYLKTGCSLIDNEGQAAAVQPNLFKLFDSDSERETEADGFRKLFRAGCKWGAERLSELD